MSASKIAADMSPERLARHFSRQGSGYLVNKDIREMVLFAQHDVIQAPPFTKLDFLSCRNLMIYFNAALQRRLIPLFHYSLRPDGTLLLGGSETVGNAQALFTPLSPKSRLFARNGNAAQPRSVDFPILLRPPLHHPPQEPLVTPTASQPANLQALADQALLQAFSPPAVLVNEQGDIVYISGSTGKYLEPAAGKANWNIHVMARPAIRVQVAAALRQALQDPDELSIDTVERYQGGAREVIIISCCVHNETQLSSLVNLSEEGVDRKLNVALTRARKHLIMLGNADVLSKDERYRAFIERYRVDF